MKTINPDDPWYPTKRMGHTHQGPESHNPGVPIRLNLATEMMKSPHTVRLAESTWTPSVTTRKVTALELVDAAFELADAMIERANRDA